MSKCKPLEGPLHRLISGKVIIEGAMDGWRSVVLNMTSQCFLALQMSDKPSLVISFSFQCHLNQSGILKKAGFFKIMSVLKQIALKCRFRHYVSACQFYGHNPSVLIGLFNFT